MLKRRSVPRLTTTPAEQLVPLSTALGPDYPEVWRTIAECIHIGLHAADADLDEQRRIEMTMLAADVLRAELGGQQPYLPKGDDYEAALEYRELYRRFNGRNIPQLASESNVSVRVLYKYFSILRREEIRSRQGSLDLGGAT